jgi:hypothetical protein
MLHNEELHFHSNSKKYISRAFIGEYTTYGNYHKMHKLYTLYILYILQVMVYSLAVVWLQICLG